MHVITAQPLKDAPVMNQAVIRNEVSLDQLRVVEGLSQENFLPLEGKLATAVGYLNAGILLQGADHSRQRRFNPLIVIELIGADVAPSHHQTFVDPERGQSALVVVPYVNHAVVH